MIYMCYVVNLRKQCCWPFLFLKECTTNDHHGSNIAFLCSFFFSIGVLRRTINILYLLNSQFSAFGVVVFLCCCFEVILYAYFYVTLVWYPLNFNAYHEINISQ